MPPSSPPGPVPQSPQPQVAVLDGVLERVTFCNPETGYTIARVAPERGTGRGPVSAGTELVTAVGPLLGAQVGESLRLRGRWSSSGRRPGVSGYLLAVLGIAGGLFAAAIGDMVSEEVRDRLDHLPRAILRLAAHRLGTTECTSIYADEWLPELTYILQGDEARPVSRVYHGTHFALGMLMSQAVKSPSAPWEVIHASSARGGLRVGDDGLLVERPLLLVGTRPQVLLELADHHRPQLCRRQAAAPRRGNAERRLLDLSDAERGLAGLARRSRSRHDQVPSGGALCNVLSPEATYTRPGC